MHVSAVYDYLGRRVARTVYGSPNVVTKYAYDGDRIIAEYDGSGTLRRKFIYGPGIDEPICLIEVADNNAVYYYHLDGLGSVVALSHVNRVLVERYTYDVFGRPTIRDANGTEIADSAFGNPYRFTGRAYDAETALYYYRARYYDYATARFLQPDPIGYADELNLYTYVGNNCTNYVDPLGLCKEDADQPLEAGQMPDWIPPEDRKPFGRWLDGDKKTPQVGRRPDQHYGPEGLREKYEEWKELGKPRGPNQKARKPWQERAFDTARTTVTGAATAIGQAAAEAAEWASEHPVKATIIVVGGAIIVVETGGLALVAVP